MNIRHQRILSPEQIRDYHDTGYLNLRQVLDPQLLTRLISTTERLYDEGRSLQQKSKHYDLEPAHTAQAPRITPARGPPLWDGCDVPMGDVVEVEPDWGEAAQVAPDFEVDQRVSW